VLFYTIYKTTNRINGKFYIGKHQTKNLDDGYLGSGKLLKRAITKYGIEHFSKQILHIFDNEAHMNAKEKELVVISEQSYNLCPGGKGGFGYINQLRKTTRSINPMKNPATVKKRIDTIARKYGLNFLSSLLRKANHNKPNYMTLDWVKENHKNGLPKDHQKGQLNSQYGKRFVFVNNGVICKKIPLDMLDDFVAKGFQKGKLRF